MIVIALAPPQTGEEIRVLRQGDPFPDLSFPNVLNEQERMYLGLGEPGQFTGDDLAADLLVVEFLNKYCFHCQVQAPVFVMVYNTLQADAELRGRVKMIGIGAGNSRHQLEAFREETGVQFPLIPDPDFVAYDAVGSPKTPFTVLLRKDTGGRRIVASVHRGVVYSDKGFVEEIKAVLQYDIGLLTLGRSAEAMPAVVKQEVKPPLTEEELLDRLRRAMEASGGTVTDLLKVELPASGEIYIGSLDVDGGTQKRFAKVVSRASFCDVCHDIHYIYVFDEGGTVLRFDPIYLTKKGNWEWDEKDVKKMQERLQGRSLLEAFPFDPEVDAVTSATISSQLLFRSLGEGRNLYQELQKEGYLQRAQQDR